jgi:hypothetical protein
MHITCMLLHKGKYAPNLKIAKHFCEITDPEKKSEDRIQYNNTMQCYITNIFTHISHANMGKEYTFRYKRILQG